MGYKLMATEGTARRLEAAGIEVRHVKKLQEGHPNLLDYLVDGGIQLIINTPSGKGARTDEGRIRAAAVARGVPCITTIQAADAAVRAMEALRDEEITVQALQDRLESLVRAASKRSVSPCDLSPRAWSWWFGARLAILAKARTGWPAPAPSARWPAMAWPIWSQRLHSTAMPWGTLAVNALGCLLFGVVWSLAEERMLISSQARTIVLVGFMGAFTTFSTYAFETAQMLGDSEWLLAAGNLLVQNVLGIALVLAGMALGRLF